MEMVVTQVSHRAGKGKTAVTLEEERAVTPSPEGIALAIKEPLDVPMHYVSHYHHHQRHIPMDLAPRVTYS